MLSPKEIITLGKIVTQHRKTLGRMRDGSLNVDQDLMQMLLEDFIATIEDVVESDAEADAVLPPLTKFRTTLNVPIEFMARGHADAEDFLETIDVEIKGTAEHKDDMCGFEVNGFERLKEVK